jgi:hypothetical protein
VVEEETSVIISNAPSEVGSDPEESCKVDTESSKSNTLEVPEAPKPSGLY